MTINRVLFDFQCEVLFCEYFFSLKTNETISTINDNDDYFVRFNLVDSINRTDNVTAQLHIIQVVVQIISNKGCYIIVGQYLCRLVSLVAITSDADTHMHARARFLSRWMMIAILKATEIYKANTILRPQHLFVKSYSLPNECQQWRHFVIM